MTMTMRTICQIYYYNKTTTIIVISVKCYTTRDICYR